MEMRQARRFCFSSHTTKDICVYANSAPKPPGNCLCVPGKASRALLCPLLNCSGKGGLQPATAMPRFHLPPSQRCPQRKIPSPESSKDRDVSLAFIECAPHLPMLLSSSLHLSSEEALTGPILQVRRPKLREIKEHAQGHNMEIQTQVSSSGP